MFGILWILLSFFSPVAVMLSWVQRHFVSTAKRIFAFVSTAMCHSHLDRVCHVAHYSHKLVIDMWHNNHLPYKSLVLLPSGERTLLHKRSWNMTINTTHTSLVLLPSGERTLLHRRSLKHDNQHNTHKSLVLLPSGERPLLRRRSLKHDNQHNTRWYFEQSKDILHGLLFQYGRFTVTIAVWVHNDQQHVGIRDHCCTKCPEITQHKIQWNIRQLWLSFPNTVRAKFP